MPLSWANSRFVKVVQIDVLKNVPQIKYLKAWNQFGNYFEYEQIFMLAQNYANVRKEMAKGEPSEYFHTPRYI